MKFNESYVLRLFEGKPVLAQKGEEGKITKIVKLNEIAEVIIRGLQKGLTKESIIQTILANYNVDAATAEKDFDEFVAQLLGLGVLENN